MATQRTYLAIDLKSFFASVECVERGLDPLFTNLVVADITRTEKTICLAVSPSLKAYGIPGRPRLFEVIEKVRQANAQRISSAPYHKFSEKNTDARELAQNASLAIDYIVASPHMARYMACSNRVYQIYLQYVAPEDIHVYSVDEVLMDVTDYLKTYGLTARMLAQKMIAHVLRETGVTATAGIGTNLYLCKIAMDIMAKHIVPDENGVRIAELDEQSYRKNLWEHRPLTDFWRVGRGYARKLESNGLYTMGDIARCSLGKQNDLHNEELLFRLFGVNAELLIDHAWGYEPCGMADIKAYKPETNSVGGGQVLQCPYSVQKARIVVHEMANGLSLNLVDKGLETDQVVLTVVYDIESLTNPEIAKNYKGKTTKDYYGRSMPDQVHGTANLGCHTSSAKKILSATLALYDKLINPELLVRRIYLTANHVTDEKAENRKETVEQLDLFTDYQAEEERRAKEEQDLERERKMQQAMLQIKKKYGGNAILMGTNLEDGATAVERNKQIGGHKA